jgi:hypothetical protein
MGMQYSIEEDARLVRLTCSGLVTLDEWFATIKAVFADPAYKPGLRFLVDWRLGLTPDVDFVKRAAAHARQHRPEISGSRLAMVVSERATFGIMRLAKEQSAVLFKRGWVFTDLKEAEHWLRSG